MRALTAVDLDLDGRDELVLTAQKEPPEVLHLGTRGEIVKRAALPSPAAGSLLRADLNGDGSPDALFGGDKLSVVLASHDQPEQVQLLADDFASSPNGRDGYQSRREARRRLHQGQHGVRLHTICASTFRACDCRSLACERVRTGWAGCSLGEPAASHRVAPFCGWPNPERVRRRTSRHRIPIIELGGPAYATGRFAIGACE